MAFVRRLLVVLAALFLPLASVAAAAPIERTDAPVVRAAATASPAPPVTDNPFIPPDKNLSDCVSANPLPGCGSKAHGGWRQFLVFVMVALAMAFIGWRIVHIVRRNRKQIDAEDTHEEISGRR